MPYVVKWNNACVEADGILEHKVPQSWKSFAYLTFSGDNSWTTEEITIDASAITDVYTGISKTIVIADFAGSIPSAPTKDWETEEVDMALLTASSSSLGAGPGHAIIELPNDRIHNSKVTLTRTTPDPEGKQFLQPDYDYTINEELNQVEMLRSIYDNEILIIGYWTESSRTFVTDTPEALAKTVDNIAKEINRTTGLGVLAIIRNRYEILIEATWFGTDPENGDDITVERSNVGSGEILINGQNVDGPLPLGGFETNAVSIGAGILLGWNYEDDYMKRIGMYVIGKTQERHYTDDEFESQENNIKEDLARYVTKQILIVTKDTVVLNAFEVLHSGYIDVDQI